MEGLSDEEKVESKRDLIAYCTAVAHACQRLPASEPRLSAVEEDQIADIAKAIGKPRV